jgi:hypothetical protein
MTDALVHQGIEILHGRFPFPLEFTRFYWEERRINSHDGVPFIVLMKEYRVYRRSDISEKEERWAFATGLHRLLHDGKSHAGNRAFCLRKLDEYRRANPQGLSDDLLTIIDEFIKNGEATDGRKSIPTPDHRDQGR